MLRKRRSVLSWALVAFLSVVTPFTLKAAEKMDAAKVKKMLKTMGISQVEVLGVQPAPVKGLYMVYVKLGDNRRAAFVLSKDGRYLITGKLVDIKEGGKDLTMEVGVNKGYFPLPSGRSLKDSKVRINTTGSPVFGPSRAPEVVVYFDPLCPFCLKELRDLKPMAEEGKIRLVLKYFIVHGDKARNLAYKALCLYQQGQKRAFWDFIFSRGATGGDFRGKCDEGKVELILTRDGEEAQKLQLRGTPASIIRGKVYTGYLGRVVLTKILSEGGG